ncbi:hypothetical protein Nepgr_022544 [Nepenthes gracilis]|uniref:Uncharacterized protein n=1 Tax=Nepenthes gracilis TaxID=150966 RepID=A0AAD3SZ25_NEPGR|nr:hypothetical protein Nepgr_022544 [Nepenthes gracilis]
MSGFAVPTVASIALGIPLPPKLEVITIAHPPSSGGGHQRSLMGVDVVGRSMVEVVELGNSMVAVVGKNMLLGSSMVVVVGRCTMVVVGRSKTVEEIMAGESGGRRIMIYELHASIVADNGRWIARFVEDCVGQGPANAVVGGS